MGKFHEVVLDSSSDSDSDGWGRSNGQLSRQQRMRQVSNLSIAAARLAHPRPHSSQGFLEPSARKGGASRARRSGAAKPKARGGGPRKTSSAGGSSGFGGGRPAAAKSRPAASRRPLTGGRKPRKKQLAPLAAPAPSPATEPAGAEPAIEPEAEPDAAGSSSDSDLGELAEDEATAKAVGFSIRLDGDEDDLRVMTGRTDTSSLPGIDTPVDGDGYPPPAKPSMFSMGRPFSAPGNQGRSKDARMRMRLLGFTDDMESEERGEFFELCRERQAKLAEGESGVSIGQLGLRSPKLQNSSFLDGAMRNLTPRRSFIDGCCEAQLLPIPLLRNCSRPRPKSGGVRRSRTNVLQGGGRATPAGGVAHLDLANRLIPERRWAQKRSSGIDPSTGELGPTRNRADILAQTLENYSLGLKSLDFSNNNLDDTVDAYITKAGSILTRDVKHVVGYNPKASAGGSHTSYAAVPHNPDASESSGDLSVARASARAMLKLSSPALESLIGAIRTQSQLTSVDLSSNRIGVQGATALAAVMFDRGCVIENLDLSGNRFGDKAMGALSVAMGSSRRLQRLALRDCDLGDVGGISIAEALQDNRSLESLDISWNHIRARGGAAFGALLIANDVIADLNLAWNGVGHVEMLELNPPTPPDDGKDKKKKKNPKDEPPPPPSIFVETQPGAEEIGGAIRKNTTLRTLNLSHNRIQTMGAFVIADGMDENKSINRLTMDGNPIGFEGGRELLRAMRNLGDIREISMVDCNIKQSEQRLVNFDPTKPDNDGKPYELDISKKYDQAVVNQLLRIKADSNGRDIWEAVTLSTSKCAAKRALEVLDPANVDEKVKELIDVANGWLPTDVDVFDRLCILRFKHKHVHREATDEDVVSSSALLKLKGLFRASAKLNSGPDKAVESYLLEMKQKPFLNRMLEGNFSKAGSDDAEPLSKLRTTEGWASVLHADPNDSMTTFVRRVSTAIQGMLELREQKSNTAKVSGSAKAKVYKAVANAIRLQDDLLEYLLQVHRRPFVKRMLEFDFSKVESEDSKMLNSLMVTEGFAVVLHADPKGGTKLEFAQQAAASMSRMKVLQEYVDGSSSLHNLMLDALATKRIADKKRAIELAEERAAEAKVKSDQAVVIRSKIAHQMSSATTEDQKKRQQDLLTMTSKEFYFRAEQVGQLLDLFDDKVEKATAVVKLFERVLDTDELLEIVEEKLDAEHRMIIQKQLGLLYTYDAKNPTGHYRIDLSTNFERLVAMKLLAASNGENDERQKLNLIDTSQRCGHERLGRYNFRNQSMNGKPMSKKIVTMPDEGIFEFDYVSTFLNGDPRPDARGPLMKPSSWRRFIDTLGSWFAPALQGTPFPERDRERIINLVRKEMKNGRFVTAKQVCAILYTAKIMPTYCFCTYCWNEVDEERGKDKTEVFGKRERGEMNLADRIFLPCQHMVCCHECAEKLQRNFSKCAFCALRVEEITTWDNRKKWEKKYPGITEGSDYGAKRVKREFGKFDADDSGFLDRGEVEELITTMLGSKTTEEDIAKALNDMDEDSSGEIDYKEFAAWWKREHSDEHPAGADCFNVKSRIDEMISRKCLKAMHNLESGEKQFAGDRDFAIELVITLFGRTVDLLQVTIDDDRAGG